MLRSYFLDELYGLWLDLKYLAEDLGNVCSNTYIYYLCYTFMTLMGSTYLFLANITNFESDNKYEFGGLAFIIAVAFGMIADCAHRTINQVIFKNSNYYIKLQAFDIFVMLNSWIRHVFSKM